MEEKTKETEIIIKSKPRQQMMESPMSELILKEKEFFVETEGEDDTFVARFKIGDGKTKYLDLPYQSSIYKLFPEFYLYNNNYSYGVKIKFKNE